MNVTNNSGKSYISRYWGTACAIVGYFSPKLTLLNNILNLITNHNFINNGIWIAFNTLIPKEDIGKLNENGNMEIFSDTD